MEAQAQSVQSIFNNSRHFKIPYFQRQYVWGKENWERFWNDLSNLVDNPHIYFLGSIIAKKDNLEYTLIDGQQRSTTLFLLLKALYLQSGNNTMFYAQYFQRGKTNNGPILTHNKHDRPIFEEILLIDNYANPLNSSGNVLDAWINLTKKVRELTPAKAELMQERIEEYVRFVYITLSEEDDEQQIFDTINSLGVDLTTGELLKNYFFNKNNESVYSTLWAPVFERANSDYWADSLVKGRIKESNIEQFFYALLQIVMCNPAYKVSSETKKAYRLKDQVFANYKHLFRTQNIEANKDPFIAKTVEYGKLYQNNFNKKVLDLPIKPAPDVKRLAIIMYARKMMSFIPYILYVLHNQADETEQLRIFGYLEAYIVRRIICGAATGNYADLFSENLIGQNIFTYQGLRYYIENKGSDVSLSMPSDQEIRTSIQSKNLSGNASLILYMLESMSQGQNITLQGLNSYVAEQLLPSKANAGWPLVDKETDDDRKLKAQTLGNFVLIPSKDKLKGKDHKNWAATKAALLPSSSGLNDLLHPVNQANWTKDEITTQNEQLADLICQYWPKDGVAVTVTQNQTLTATTTAPAVATDTVDDITVEAIKPLLPFSDVDYAITDLVYRSLYPESFEAFIQSAIDSNDDAAQMGSAIVDRYQQQCSGIIALTRSELIDALGQTEVELFETAHPLYYIGKCKNGWIVSLDHKHFLRRPSSMELKDLLEMANGYTQETIDGLWNLLLKDTQLKGVLTAINEEESIDADKFVYKKSVESLINFLSTLDNRQFASHPSEAKSFDDLRESLSLVLERNNFSGYIDKYPWVFRMLFDVISYIEDYYLENGNIDLNFKKTRRVGMARVTFLDTGTAPEEMPQRDALRLIAAMYAQNFRKLTVDGTTSLMLNSITMTPGPSYEPLGNGWYLYKLAPKKVLGQLVIMANMVRDKVLVEILPDR